MSNGSIWPKDRTIPAATTPEQSGPGSDVNEGALYILQSSPSHFLVSYLEHLLEESYPSAEMQ